MFSQLKGPLTLLALLLAVVIVVYLGFLIVGAPASPGMSAIPDTFTPVPPSPEVVAMLEESKGFEVLVSYTERGFEPAEVAISEGQSIRFTNNSFHDLWVAALGTEGSPAYPGVSECGGSTLDTCKVLRPREFWEFTFDESGEWMFHNNLDKGKTDTVRVNVQ